MTIDRTEPVRCPGCFAKLDTRMSVTASNGAKPGDVTLCIYCCALAVFNEDMISALITQEQYEALPDRIKAQYKQYVALSSIVTGAAEGE